MSDKPHLSSSQIEMLSLCGERYRRRYICGEKIPPAIAMVVGSGVHTGAEINFEQKIESHRDLPQADIVEAAVAGFEDIVDEDGVELSSEDRSRGKGVVLGEAKDLVVTLAKLHAETQAPDYQPVAIEKEVTIPMPDATHDMLGYVDLIDDKRRVVDFKTAAKAKSQSEADTSAQLTIYAAAFMIDNGAMPAEVRLDTLVKTKVPKRQVLTSTRSIADVKPLVARINTALKIIEAGIFMPAAVGSWVCSPLYCGYYRTCPYVNSERRAAEKKSD